MSSINNELVLLKQYLFLWACHLASWARVSSSSVALSTWAYRAATRIHHPVGDRPFDVDHQIERAIGRALKRIQYVRGDRDYIEMSLPKTHGLSIDFPDQGCSKYCEDVEMASLGWKAVICRQNRVGA